jgi:EAL domain-containing protein (putative c-di-GMP-specific phosphodiesterase class I)
MLDALHALGIALHIDDFGTGYSSLEALHNLPLDALKIDRAFVARLDTDPRSAELVRTIVLMGANLGLDLIAEGVETVSQRDRLHRLGCTYGQGYLFSRPVPAAGAELVAAAMQQGDLHQIAAGTGTDVGAHTA